MAPAPPAMRSWATQPIDKEDTVNPVWPEPPTPTTPPSDEAVQWERALQEQRDADTLGLTSSVIRDLGDVAISGDDRRTLAEQLVQRARTGAMTERLSKLAAASQLTVGIRHAPNHDNGPLFVVSLRDVEHHQHHACADPSLGQAVEFVIDWLREKQAKGYDFSVDAPF